MILQELYKVFIKQRLLIFLLVLLASSLIYRIIVGYDSTSVIRNSEKYYTALFEKYEGKITDEKSSQIRTEYREIQTDSTSVLASTHRKQAFESFYHTYLYEVESGSGYLTDTRGWETILCHSNINYFLVIFIVLLGVILFSVEYENEMDVMIISTSERSRLTKCKILIGALGAMIASLIFWFASIIYLVMTVGLKNGSYPLNTIEFFEGTLYNISLYSGTYL